MRDLTPLERNAAAYFDRKVSGPDAMNRLLGPDLSYSVYHHFGLGKISDLDDLVRRNDEQEMKGVLHRLESLESAYLIGLLQKRINKYGRVLDAGSGSGGTTFDVNSRYRCGVDGVNISERQVKLTNALAEQRGVADRVRFHLQNMRRTEFDNNTFDAAITNETTLYVDLNDLYGEMARVLKPGGVYAAVSWCKSNTHTQNNQFAEDIDAHYGTSMHYPRAYLESLRSHGFWILEFKDLTVEAIDYWKLRIKLPGATGVEQPFLDGFEQGFLKYISILAELRE
jgi:geranyl diphosphate 2-C-methyltransferase